MTGSIGISLSNEGSEISKDATESVKDWQERKGTKDTKNRRRQPKSSHDTPLYAAIP